MLRAGRSVKPGPPVGLVAEAASASMSLRSSAAPRAGLAIHGSPGARRRVGVFLLRGCGLVGLLLGRAGPGPCLGRSRPRSRTFRAPPHVSLSVQSPRGGRVSCGTKPRAARKGRREKSLPPDYLPAGLDRKPCYAGALFMVACCARRASAGRSPRGSAEVTTRPAPFFSPIARPPPYHTHTLEPPPVPVPRAASHRGPVLLPKNVCPPYARFTVDRMGTCGILMRHR